jgi:predicted dehydrogenase
MTHSPIRVGLIGLGAIGHRLATGFAQHPAYQIASLCDTNTVLAERLCAELGAAAWSTDYRDMLQGDQVDLVYIGVPPRLHRNITLDVIAAGKHILCEKPLALHLDEAHEMTQAVQASGLVHALNMGIHYAPGIEVLREQIAEGYVGQIRQIHLDIRFPRWPRDWQQNPWIGKREQGGAIREVTPHLFHVLMQIFGPIDRVQAQMQWPDGDPEGCEQAASGMLHFAAGQTAVVSLLTNVAQTERVETYIYGTAGTLALRNWAMPFGAQESDGELQALEYRRPDRGLMENLAMAVRGEQADLPRFEHGLRIQQVLDAWERAAASGCWQEVER